jgi:hypothetical protein
VNFRSLLHRRLDLYELHIVNPEIRFNVDAEGRTSLPTPTPPKEEGPEAQFVVSIENLKVTAERHSSTTSSPISILRSRT